MTFEKVSETALVPPTLMTYMHPKKVILSDSHVQTTLIRIFIGLVSLESRDKACHSDIALLLVKAGKVDQRG